MDSKIKNSKLLRKKLSKVDIEQAGRSSNMSFLYEGGGEQIKAVLPSGLKDSSSSLDYVKNVIPPITQNYSTMTSSISGTPGLGTMSGTHNYRYTFRVKQ